MPLMLDDFVPIKTQPIFTMERTKNINRRGNLRQLTEIIRDVLMNFDLVLNRISPRMKSTDGLNSK